MSANVLPMSLVDMLSQLAQSDKGRELLGKAKELADDPKTRAKLDEAFGVLEGQIQLVRHMLAEQPSPPPDGEPDAA